MSERAMSLTEAAGLMGWSRRTLTRALERHGIATIGTGRRARLESLDLKFLKKMLLGDLDALGLLYVIQGLPETPIKIGFCNSEGLRNRLSSLQTGNPYELRVLCHTQAHPLDERSAHAALAADRMAGEWFAWTVRTATFVEALPGGLSAALEAIEKTGVTHA